MHGKNFVRTTMHGRPFNSHNSHKCEEGKNTFGRNIFFCFFPLLISLCTRTRFIFSFLMHTHKVCIWKENILFSFISYAQAHDLAFFFGTIHCLLPLFSIPSASIVYATSVQATGAPIHHRRTRLPVSAVPATYACFCSSHQCLMIC